MAAGMLLVALAAPAVLDNVASSGLIAWFSFLLVALGIAGAVAGYVLLEAVTRRGPRHAATTVYALLALATVLAIIRVFQGDVRIMIQSPLTGVATAQYILLGLLAVAFLVFALVLGWRQFRHLAERLRVRIAMAQGLAEHQEEMETFTAAAAHDLRATLRTISGGAALAARYVHIDPDKAKGLLEQVQAATIRMDDLLTALLDYSRIASAEPEWRPFGAGDVARQVVADLAAEIDETQADVAIEGDAELDGDARLVRQAIQNLLHNALKYTDEAPWVRIRIDDGEDVRIRVLDHGRGIPEDEQDRILSAFERGSSGKDIDGTGLGLATVRRIMELHGGHVSLSSTIGHGSVFTLTFPRIRPVMMTPEP